MSDPLLARGCFTEDELFSIASGAIISDSQELFESHVATCDGCAAVVAHLARERVGDTEGGDAIDALTLGPGAHIGRYTILALAGLGGMGRVYAAWDPELDRKVALKLLPPARGDDAAQERLRREAQAMAKLSHGNVVAVHDVGTWPGGRFLAMEFVDGQTLQSWLRARTRTWREIVDVFVQAGRGLGAAHAAGLVHRDFKPTNVLVRTDGRVAVTDFGLARVIGTANESGALPEALRETADSIIAGTPAYMAPEQLDGKDLDARTDVFSFCVALYEALWGQHPFSTESRAALVESVQRGDVRPPPPSAVPQRVRRAVMAGLASDPSARPATMGDLLARLATGPRRARASALAAAVVVVVGAASAVALRHGAVQDCQGAEAHLAGVWDAPRRAEIRLAFQRSGLPGAEQMVASVLRSFDSYGDKWRAGWVDACEATRVHGSQSEALMDARMLCLDDRARAWAAIGDTLAHADPAALDKAIAAMADLPSPVACADPRHLDRSSAQSPVARARSEALRGQIATIKADVEFGRTLVAKEKIAAGLAEARALHSGAFEAELLTAEGKNEVTAEPVAAVAAYHAAAQAAERAGREDLLADARVALVHALGWQLHRIDEALQWADYAQTTIDRLGDPDLAITLAGVRAEALERGAQASRALPLTEQVLVYRQQHANGPDLAVARALNQVAIDHADLYHVDVALDYFRQTVAAYEQLYGTEHLATLMVKGNLAAQLKNAGRSEEARMLFEEVIAAIERQMGRDHLRLLGPYDNLGRTLGDLGHYRESEAAIRHSIEIGEKHLGPTSPATAQEYSYLSLELTAMGRVDDALATAQHGLALLDIKAEAKEPRAFLSYLSIGHAYQEMGRCADALAAFDRAEAQIKSAGMEGELDWVAIERVDCQLELGHAPEALAAVEAALGHARTRYADDNLFLADFLVVVARARLAAGKASDALEPAQRAVATLTAHKVVGFKLVRAQFTLARVMWETQPEQRGHAVELARQALAGAQPLVHTKDTIARWLQNH